MPYKAFERDGKWRVYKTNADGDPLGDAYGEHESEASANAQVRALYANVEEMTDAQRERIDEVYRKYHDTVNMSASELEAWADTEYSKAASLDRSPIERNLRLLRKPKAEWDAADVRAANRTISFVSRMRGVSGGKPVSKDIPYSKREISLKNWAFDPGKVSEQLSVYPQLTQAEVEYVQEAAGDERCANCWHWSGSTCSIVPSQPLQIVAEGSCNAWIPVTEGIEDMEEVREIVREYRTYDFPTNSVPVVETYAEVDVALLTKGDSDPFYIVLPIARIGELSGNGIYYDQELVDAIAEQLKGLGGIRGHIPADQRSTAYPLSDVHWVGHQRVGETLWAKGYIPPGDTREDIRRTKARGGKLSTSIYGNGVAVADKDGNRRLLQFVLEQVDLAPPQRAAVNLGGDFAIVSEMQTGKEENSKMDTANLKTMLAEMGADSIYEMLTSEQLSKVVEMYLKKSGKRMVASEMADTIVSQSTRIAEMEAAQELYSRTLQERNRELDELRHQEFVRRAGGVVAELIAWEANTPQAQEKIEALRKHLRENALVKMTGRDLEQFRAIAVQEMQAPSFRVLAESVRDMLSGSPAYTTPESSKGITTKEVGKVLDPDYIDSASNYFGF